MKSFFQSILTNVRAVIGLTVILLGFAFVFALLFVKIPPDNIHTIELCAGFVLGVLVSVGSYYFGSSKDTSDKAKADQTNLQSPPLPQVQDAIVDKP